LHSFNRKQIEVCTAQFFAARVGAGVQDPDPIFIVGLPRSGSTLLEQILASHSKVEGTQELIQRIVLEMQGTRSDLDDPRYPDVYCESRTRTSLRTSRETCEASWTSAASNLNRLASSSTGQNAVFIRQAQSRSVSRSSTTGFSSGGITRPGLAR